MGVWLIDTHIICNDFVVLQFLKRESVKVYHLFTEICQLSKCVIDGAWWYTLQFIFVQTQWVKMTVFLPFIQSGNIPNFSSTKSQVSLNHSWALHLVVVACHLIEASEQ